MSGVGFSEKQIEMVEGDGGFVSDSDEYDIRPANERGYRTVLVGDEVADVAGTDPDSIPDIEISDPSELATLSGRL